MSKTVVGVMIAVLIAIFFKAFTDHLKQDGGIWEAAYRNDVDTLRRLLSSSPASPPSSSPTNDSAPSGGSVANQKVTVHSRDEYRNTPLHWAAKSGALQAISFLLSQNADILAANHAGSTPLHWAATNTAAATAVTPTSATAAAASSDRTAAQTLRALLEYGGGSSGGGGRRVEDGVGSRDMIARKLAANVVNNDKETPLHWAVHWQSESAVQYLLSAAVAANPNAVDVHKNTPLHKIPGDCTDSAVCRRIVSRLLKAGAEVTVQNEFGRKALDHFDTTKAAPDMIDDS